MFKKFLSNKKRTMLLCAVLIFGVMLGVGAKILVTKAALKSIDFDVSEAQYLNMNDAVIENLTKGTDNSAAPVNYVNSVVNGEEPSVGMWLSPAGNSEVYLNIGEGYTNVGIGTTNPGAKLEINGALKFTETDSDAVFISEVTSDNDNDVILRVTMTDDNSDDERFEIYTDHYDGDTNDRVVHYFTAAGNAYHYGDMEIAGDLTVVDAFTISGVLTAESGIDTNYVTTDKIQKSNTGASIEFDASGNVVITIP